MRFENRFILTSGNFIHLNLQKSLGLLINCISLCLVVLYDWQSLLKLRFLVCVWTVKSRDNIISQLARYSLPLRLHASKPTMINSFPYKFCATNFSLLHTCVNASTFKLSEKLLKSSFSSIGTHLILMLSHHFYSSTKICQKSRN